MRDISNIVVLTGAGISAESGLGTFRGPEGLWENHRVEDVATPEAFARDPDLVQRFYDARRANLAEVASLAVPDEEHELAAPLPVLIRLADVDEKRSLGSQLLRLLQATSWRLQPASRHRERFVSALPIHPPGFARPIRSRKHSI